MPTYPYGCDSCGHEFEVFQKVTNLPIRECPRCNGVTATRRISAPPFILKGGGWYADGYSRSPSPSTGTSSPRGASKND